MREEKKGVLVLDGDAGLRTFFVRELGKAYKVRGAATVGHAVEILEGGDVDLLVLGEELPDGARAFEVREYLRKKGFDLPAILTTAQGHGKAAVEALRRGFSDYLSREPRELTADLVRTKVDAALRLHALRQENERLNAQIEESQQRLFSVYDSLDDVIMQIDSDCRVHSANRAGAALANRDPKEVVGRVCWEVFDFYPCQKRRRKDKCHIYRTFLEGETISGERRGESGRTYQYMTFITTHKGKDYTVYRETDVTAKRALEDKLDHALQSILGRKKSRA